MASRWGVTSLSRWVNPTNGGRSSAELNGFYEVGTCRFGIGAAANSF